MTAVATCPFCAYQVAPARSPSGALVCPMCRNTGKTHAVAAGREHREAFEARMLSHVRQLQETVAQLGSAQAQAGSPAHASASNAVADAKFEALTDQVVHLRHRVNDIMETMQAWEAAAAQEAAEEAAREPAKDARLQEATQAPWTSDEAQERRRAQHTPSVLASAEPQAATFEDKLVAQAAGPDDEPTDFSDVPPVMHSEPDFSGVPPVMRAPSSGTSAHDMLRADSDPTRAVAQQFETPNLPAREPRTDIDASIDRIERQLRDLD